MKRYRSYDETVPLMQTIYHKKIQWLLTVPVVFPVIITYM